MSAFARVAGGFYTQARACATLWQMTAPHELAGHCDWRGLRTFTEVRCVSHALAARYCREAREGAQLPTMAQWEAQALLGYGDEGLVCRLDRTPRAG